MAPEVSGVYSEVAKGRDRKQPCRALRAMPSTGALTLNMKGSLVSTVNRGLEPSCWHPKEGLAVLCQVPWSGRDVWEDHHEVLNGLNSRTKVGDGKSTWNPGTHCPRICRDSSPMLPL